MSNAWTSTVRTFSAALLRPDQKKPADVQADDKRFNVYRNNVTISLIRALEANFPGIKTLVGEDFFRAMARDFVQARPPKSRLLFEYGSELGEFIARAPSLAAYPYLSDVAGFEHLWLESFHEADTAPLQSDTFQRLFAAQGEGLRLAAHPAARFIHSVYPVHAIVTASRAGESFAPVDLSQPEWCVLVRPALAVQAHALPKGEFMFLKSMADGVSLDEAADTALAADPAVEIESAILKILTLGAFADHDLVD